MTQDEWTIQAWICPKCYDDHGQTQECSPSLAGDPDANPERQNNGCMIYRRNNCACDSSFVCDAHAPELENKP